jgi:hypothetical protein
LAPAIPSSTHRPAGGRGAPCVPPGDAPAAAGASSRRRALSAEQVAVGRG